MRTSQILACVLTLILASAANAQAIDWNKVDAALGKTAAVSGEVHRYGFPRSDLQVTLDGVAIKPALALGGWAAFLPMRSEAMVMGDLVLLETEVQSGHDQTDRRRHRRYGGSQSLVTSQSSNVLHAYRRPWRPGENGRSSSISFGTEQDAA